MDRHYRSLTGKWCPGIDPYFSFLPKHRLCDIHIDMLDCCNGLFLCRRQNTDYWRTTDYVVCNPATEEWVAVPGTDRSSEVRVARLGFDPAVSSHFHVLEFAPADDDTHVRPLGIYSSQARVWTHRSDWECPIDIDRYSCSTFFRGVLYLSSYEDKVVAVEMEGNCRVIRIPTSHDSCVAREVYVSQGQLYFVISSESELSMWALEDSTSTENWTLKHNVSRLQLFGAGDPSYDLYYDVIIHPEYKVIFILFTRRISTCISFTKVMSYDMDSRELHSVGDLGYDCKSPYLSYVPLFSHSFIR
ncbi:hypothetical protein CFC21_102047 [Triticum aestivum]|uniref:F-box protein At3g26010-like beta-propeller domain-containing protein n=2 Tax=Triticum aestivum TaxID=4565 RepID=A0A3B6SG60_WHEAT|nr:hypothetical protein CFC21_102047 [Triticum aestivum]